MMTRGWMVVDGVGVVGDLGAKYAKHIIIVNVRSIGLIVIV